MDILLNDILHLDNKDVEKSKMSLNISSGKNAPLCIKQWLEDESVDAGFSAYSGKQRNFQIG